MSVITSIHRLNGKVRITDDQGEERIIPLSVYRGHPLSQGDDVDLARYMQNLAPYLYRHAIDKAVKYLAVRARSRKEVETRLLMYGFPEETVEMAIYKLEKTGLINDADFAREWTQARAEKGKGKRNIARDLHQKGISHKTTQIALEELDDEQQLLKARELAEKWLPRYKDDDRRDATRKLTQALIRRGYDWETARKAVGAFIDEDR